jgi:3-hydroxyisobutyrate dehydrogenase-like beta-hydroxyacid dehydrogenase
MGQGMAGSLRRAGYELHVCDARPGVAEAFAAQGGVACASPAEVAKTCQVLVSVVVNAAQTEEVLFGPEGAAAHLAKGSVFVMCSTVDPNWSVALEARLEALGLQYVDAPISGGAAKAASGQMTMMTAGKPAAYALAEPLLNAMAAKVYKLGDSAGAGSKVKIINQLLAGVHIAAAAEGADFGGTGMGFVAAAFTVAEDANFAAVSLNAGAGTGAVPATPRRDRTAPATNVGLVKDVNAPFAGERHSYAEGIQSLHTSTGAAGFVAAAFTAAEGAAGFTGMVFGAAGFTGMGFVAAAFTVSRHRVPFPHFAQ